jgi:hypothetical protein
LFEIKTRLSSKGQLGVPDEHRLKYGDGKRVVVVDGKVIDYDQLKDVSNAGMTSIEQYYNIQEVKLWGLQAINGTIKVTHRNE